MHPHPPAGCSNRSDRPRCNPLHEEATHLPPVEPVPPVPPVPRALPGAARAALPGTAGTARSAGPSGPRLYAVGTHEHETVVADGFTLSTAANPLPLSGACGHAVHPDRRIRPTGQEERKRHRKISSRDCTTWEQSRHFRRWFHCPPHRSCRRCLRDPHYSCNSIPPWRRSL